MWIKNSQTSLVTASSLNYCVNKFWRFHVENDRKLQFISRRNMRHDVITYHKHLCVIPLSFSVWCKHYVAWHIRWGKCNYHPRISGHIPSNRKYCGRNNILFPCKDGTHKHRHIYIASYIPVKHFFHFLLWSVKYL